METPYAEVLADMKARDERDSKRAAAPLKPAEDAVIMDNSELNIEEMVGVAAGVIDAHK